MLYHTTNQHNPIATENSVMQAHLTNVLMPHVLTAMRVHPSESDIQAKGLVALGVMAQVNIPCRVSLLSVSMLVCND